MQHYVHMWVNLTFRKKFCLENHNDLSRTQ